MSSDFETDQQIPFLALLNNITANAVESIADKGEIVLSILRKRTYLFFDIKDSGKGIPKEDISIIFEPGYTTKYNDKGLRQPELVYLMYKKLFRTLEGQIQVETTEGRNDFPNPNSN